MFIFGYNLHNLIVTESSWYLTIFEKFYSVWHRVRYYCFLKMNKKTYQLSLMYLQFKGLGRTKLKLQISQINSYHGQEAYLKSGSTVLVINIIRGRMKENREVSDSHEDIVYINTALWIWYYIVCWEPCPVRTGSSRECKELAVERSEPGHDGRENLTAWLTSSQSASLFMKN